MVVVKARSKVMLLQRSSNERASSYNDKQKSPIIVSQDTLQAKELIKENK